MYWQSSYRFSTRILWIIDWQLPNKLFQVPDSSWVVLVKLPNHIPDGRTSPQGQINAKQIKTGSGEILWSKKKPPHNEVVSKSGGTFDLIG